MNNSTRVARNTLFLYANMVVTTVVQLVAVRLLLKALGIVDYGIYNVIGSIIAQIAFLNVAMSAATQRYLSYAIGENNKGKLGELFYGSCILHLIIGIIVVFLIEVGGQYYIYNFLVAPTERLDAASWLMHFITFSTFANIVSVPYEADINANENMGAIAGINILDSLLKLGTAILISAYSGDRLILFGLLTMATLSTTCMLKVLYCRRNYPESHYKLHRISDWKQLRDMTGFAMWNLIGAGCSVARYHGTGFILNRFFNIQANANYGVAQQVNGMLLFFAGTILRAIRPQILKSQGAGDHQRVLTLSETTCKITSLMVAYLGIPLFVMMDFVIRIWLGEGMSADCTTFCQYFIVIVLINQLTTGLQICIESTGNIRRVQLIVGTMHLLALPAGIICYSMGMKIEAIMQCIVAEEIIALFVRTWITHSQANLHATHFLLKTILPTSATIVIVCLSMLELRTLMWECNGWITAFSIGIASSILLSVITYTLLLTNDERKHINHILRIDRLRT